MNQESLTTACQGLRVIEWGEGIAAAHCGRLLVELGATVIKIEPPEGDALRQRGPFRHDKPDHESGGLFAALNAGKRSVTLSLPERHALERLHQHLAAADVFIIAQPLEWRRECGLAIESLRSRYPDLVIASLSVLGEYGPHAGAPALSLDACAVSGVAWVIGEPGRAPLAIPLEQADWQAGAHGAAAILMAYLAGGGAQIDIAGADVLACAAGTNGLIYLCHGLQRWERAGRRAFASGGPYPYVILPCKDGAVCLIGRSRQEWTRLMQAMGNPAWAAEPRYQDLHAMGRDYPEEVDALIVPWLMQHTRAELLALGEQFGFPVGPLRTYEEVAATPQFAHREFFRSVRLPDGSELTVPGVPWRTRALSVRDVPRLGQHNESSSPDDGCSSSQGCAPRSGAAQASREERASLEHRARSEHQPSRSAQTGLEQPLAGLRVLDFSWVWSGPLVTSILAEFGAEVIKIEHGQRLDNSRLRGRPSREDGSVVEGPSIEIGPYYHQTNHNKLSITVDLKSPEARPLLEQLAAMSDVVVENLSPGALTRQGMGWSQLSALNPRLVYLSMAAAGQDGPAAGMRAYAPIMSSFCGFEALVGYADEAAIGMMNFGLGDPNAAIHALVPLLAAIDIARRTGRGQHIDMAQIEAILSVSAEPITDWFMNRRQAKPQGNRHPMIAPHGIFPALGNDRWVSVAAPDDRAWESLVSCMGNPEWARLPSYRTAAGRLAGVADIERGLAAWTARHEREWLVSTLRAAGLACSPVQDVREQWHDPHFSARGVRQTVTHPISGTEQLYRAPWLMSPPRPLIHSSAPLLGEHNDHVFGKLLGLSSDHIAALKAKGVIA